MLSQPTNLNSMLMDLETLRQSSRMDTETTIRRTIGLIEPSKKYNSSCEKLISWAAHFTLSLGHCASEMGVKRFLEDPSPFEPYQYQLRYVESFLGHHNVRGLAAMFLSKSKVDAEAERVIAELRACHDELKRKLENEAVEVEPRCDLYEDRLLDRGGHSDIYLGKWGPVGNSEMQLVAVKHPTLRSIDRDHMEGPELRERMRKRLFREMEVWRRIVHPHILPFLGYSTYPQMILISQFCQHGNLSSYLENHPAVNRVKLLSEAASGLQFLHHHTPPIVHSDIKPGNILVNDALEAVLADFGQSRFMHDAPSPYMTEDALVGTPRYMAPELLEDETARYTLASDVYAFTLVTLEVLSGRSAFYKIKMNILIAVHRGLRPQPQDFPDRASQQIWPLLVLGWSESPGQRPDIGEFVEWLKNLPETTKPPTPMYRDLNPEMLNQALQSLSNFFIPKDRLRVRETTIGVGGSGTVKLADLLGAPTTVAVKELRNRKSEGMRSAFRLAREMKVWAPCIHPNILQFTGYYLSQDFTVAYLVSPYMKNGNIRNYLAREAPPLQRRLELLFDTIKGLAYLHSRNPPVVHGDLKSLNVLINDEGNALLSDFGLARVMENEPSGLSTSRGFKGTMRCCSPEVLLGTSWEPSSDIWAWGCLALETLTNKPPYHECQNETRAVFLICGPKGIRKLPEPLDSSSMPLRVTQFLGECWSFEPHHRPNAEQCVDKLLGIIAQEKKFKP